MKIEAGKFYRTRDGRKVGPIRFDSKASRGQEFDQRSKGEDRDLGVGLWDANGYCDEDDQADLIAEWTDPIVSRAEPDTPKTWGEMSDAEKGALLLAHQEGAEIEMHLGGKWLCLDPQWAECRGYRIKPPSPIRETVTLMGQGEGGGFGFSGVPETGDTHQITFTTIGGDPIPGTYTNESGDTITMEAIGDE